MDDQELIRQFRESENKDQAFTEIVNRYRERLYAIIRGYVNDHEDTDDILQDTFLKAYRHLSGFRGESQLYTWLTRIAINQSISYLRKKKLMNRTPLDHESDRLISPHPLPDAQADHHQMQEWIREAVDRLPEKQKTVFILRYYDERSHAEIAEITGNSEGTIKANYFHALIKIKNYLSQKQKAQYEIPHT